MSILKETLDKFLKTKREVRAIGNEPIGFNFFTRTSKMPCFSFSLPAGSYCNTGKKLINVENSVCSNCYATKGRYKTYHVKENLTKRYEFVKNNIDNGIFIETFVNYFSNKKNKEYFRWHDSGDLINYNHLLTIVAISMIFPDTKFWLPTKEVGLIKRFLTELEKEENKDIKKKLLKNKNLCIRISTPMVNSKYYHFNKIPVFNKYKKRLINYSHVYENKSSVPKNMLKNICPATDKDNDNYGYCGTCRKCWDLNVLHVFYIKK